MSSSISSFIFQPKEDSAIAASMQALEGSTPGLEGRGFNWTLLRNAVVQLLPQKSSISWLSISACTCCIDSPRLPAWTTHPRMFAKRSARICLLPVIPPRLRPPCCRSWMIFLYAALTCVCLFWGCHASCALSHWWCRILKYETWSKAVGGQLPTQTHASWRCAIFHFRWSRI